MHAPPRRARHRFLRKNPVLNRPAAPSRMLNMQDTLQPAERQTISAMLDDDFGRHANSSIAWKVVVTPRGVSFTPTLRPLRMVAMILGVAAVLKALDGCFNGSRQSPMARRRWRPTHAGLAAARGFLSSLCSSHRGRTRKPMDPRCSLMPRQELSRSARLRQLKQTRAALSSCTGESVAWIQTTTFCTCLLSA